MQYQQGNNVILHNTDMKFTYYGENDSVKDDEFIPLMTITSEGDTKFRKCNRIIIINIVR